MPDAGGATVAAEKRSWCCRKWLGGGSDAKRASNSVVNIHPAIGEEDVQSGEAVAPSLL